MKINDKFRCLRFLLLVCGFFAIRNGIAQELIWAGKNKLDKRTDFTKVLGQNRHGVYVLKHKNSHFRRYFILEHFDKRMNLLKTKTFRIPDAELEKIVVHDGGVVFFTKVFEKGSFKKLLWQNIDSAMNESPALPVIGQVPEGVRPSEIRIEYNTARDRFLVWYLHDMEGRGGLSYHLLDRRSVLKEGRTELPRKSDEYYTGDALIDDSGNLFTLFACSEKFKSKSAADFEHRLIAFSVHSKKTSGYLINNSASFISAYKLVYNPEDRSVTAFGLSGTEDEDENKSYFSIRMRCSDHGILHSVFGDFDRKTVSEVLGVKNEQKGENLSKFKIRKLIPRTDGGIMAICERMFITTQSDIFYVNGIPQSSYARIFNYDDVLILHLDSGGNRVWSDIIHKNQSSVNDGGYYNGIVIMVSDDEINILYNDRLSANADIIQVTYKENGEHSKKILINNEQFYALVIPSEYNQVSANSMVVPVNQNREFTYIKLLY